MAECHYFGKRFWCVKVPKTISQNGEICLFADSVECTPSGGLVLFKDWPAGEGHPAERVPNLALAAGQWLSIHLADTLDTSAVAVTHWKGEVDRG